MNCSDSFATSSSSSSSSSSSDKKSLQCAVPNRDFNYVPTDASERAVAKGGVACPFPWRLHEVLKVAREEGLEHVVSWCPHGKAFAVHRPQEFVDKLMTRFFCQTKFASFQRQLNLYGFSRFCHGRDKGAYYHPCFIRGKRNLVRRMIRRKIKGPAASLRRPLPTEEPDFYNEEGGQVVHVAASVSPVPLFISYQSQPEATHERTFARSITINNEEDESPLDLDIADNNEDDNLGFFEGSPFHLVDFAPPTIDPAAELAKIRAQIRQKQAEYEQTVGRRHKPVSESATCTTPNPSTTQRRVSWPEQLRQGSNIPVYKGSYIAV